MLIQLFLIPLIGCLHIIFARSSYAKILAIIYANVTIMVSAVVWWEFDSAVAGIQIIQTLIESSSYNLRIGIDGTSLVFLLLTSFTIPLCILASWDMKTPKYYFPILLSFIAFTMLVFIVLDLFAFYVAFEAVLIPLFLIIGIYGGSPNKIRAAFLLFLYTLTGSLFILVGFSAMYYYTGTSAIDMLITLDIDKTVQPYIWIAIFVSIAIKTPLVPFHNWILRAHVEAPVAGSIVLAGITLKIASYGIIRILLPILPEASVILAPVANTLAIISILYASMAAIRQSDVKCLIAYSSVAHIGVAVLGIFSITYTGILGGVTLSLAHGFTSPALFYIVGGVIYDRYHTRTLKYYRGLVTYIPITMALFFLFTLANIGTPITANWVGELYSLSGAFISNPYLGAIGATTVFLSACYSIWLYNRIAFGAFSPYLTFTTDLTRREFIVLLCLLVPVLVLGVYPSLVTDLLHLSIPFFG